MKNSSKAPGMIDKVLFPHTPWILLLLIPITFFGFYPSYYSSFKAPMIIHIHGSLLVLWLAMVIVQPWFIKYGKYHWHRLTGKFSYVLMPCILVFGYLILQYGFNRVLNGDTIAPPEYYPAGAGPITKAADFVVIGSVYFFWLLMYYLLGILFRKKTWAHATFMLAATLTILGPSGDRLTGHICDAMGWQYNAFAENLNFGIVTVIFSSLLLYHRRKQLPVWPAVVVLIFHGIGVLLYHILPFNLHWERIAYRLFA